jgi:hypothetical protein
MKMSMRVSAMAAGLAVLAAAVGGCVERKITIGSEPAGALVYLNDVEVGRTPVTVPFTWYGDYDIRMRLDHTTGEGADRQVKHYFLHTHQRAKAPWFEFIGIDLFAEILPIPFKDEKVWAFPVPEVVQPTDAELIDRARELKGALDTPVELQTRGKKPGPAPATQPKR